MIDLSLDFRIFIKNELDAAVQELDLLFNTENTELINYPQFGTNFEQFLWQLSPSPYALKQYILEKINDTYFLVNQNVDVDVSTQKGEYRMIYNVLIHISDKQGNKIERKYQFR